MVLLETPAKEEGFKIVDFTLQNIDGNSVTLDECKGEYGTVVMFICNHCPYVKAIIKRLVETCRQLQKEGIGCVAIMSNDTENYPEDSFENMKLFAADNKFTFPYLIDETQDVAKNYGAVCTPDFFGFDSNGDLQYRGRLDSAGSGDSNDDTVPELLNAMLALKAGKPPVSHQYPSIGCSIKWK